MLEKMKYTNHCGEVVKFGENGLFVNESAIHDYSWIVSTDNKRISSITRDLRTFDIPAVIICQTEAEGTALRNRLHDVFEVDTVAMQPGRLTVGDYYIDGYFVASSKTAYLTKRRMLTLTLTFKADDTAWHHETMYVINPDSGGGMYLDFPFDAPYDLTPATEGYEVLNDSPFPVDFRLSIEGAVSDPVVFIAGHRYECSCDIAAGETLTIDSAKKQIYKTNSAGERTNMFHTRNRESYIFEKLPAGVLSFTKSDEFPVMLTLCEERSEPKWN